MNYFEKLRIRQIVKYGWKDSKIIHKETKRFRLKVFYDIISTFKKYYVFSLQYKQNKLWKLTSEEFHIKATELGKINKRHDEWWNDYYENRKWLSKWMKYEWETSPEKIRLRASAYQKHFKIGKNLSIQYNVDICREHELFGTLEIGNNVLLAKNVFIDYSGEVIIGDNVKLANGVIIESHTHPIFGDLKYDIADAVPKKIRINDGAIVGSNSIICENCSEIGRCAIVGAGSVVRSKVPPYAIVAGSPAKVVGYRMSLEDIIQYELQNYTEDNRIPLKMIRRNYDKYFANREKVAELLSLY